MCESHGSDITITVRAQIHKHTLVIACNDVLHKMMAESNVYTAFCDLCYSTKGRFAYLMLLKQFSNGGVRILEDTTCQLTSAQRKKCI